PVFHNPFVWDGSSPLANTQVAQKDVAVSSKPQAHEGCPQDAQPDSIDTEAADSRRDATSAYWHLVTRQASRVSC
ncbi:MAG: hypothetical protein P4L88_08955, partial [Rhodoferax sp.]|nr:hypothetical protein [Rhodoferax sp.]